MPRPTGTTAALRRVLAELRGHGLLLQSDRQLPNVASIVTGEPIVGSWWSHPRANSVHRVLEDLEDESDLLQAKLINGKVTLIYRDLWPSLFAVALSGEPWQTRGLSQPAGSLRRRVQRAHRVRTDQLLRWSSSVKPGTAARELEKRLLLYSEEVHTDSGKHAKRLETWENLMERRGFSSTLPSVANAKRALETKIATSGARLPWQ